MLSGIGDRQQLQKHGIPVVHHSPGVGLGLQDKYEVGVVSRLVGSYQLAKPCQWHWYNASDPCWKKYVESPTTQSVYALPGPLVGIMSKSDPTWRSPNLYTFAVPTDFHGYFHGWSAIKPQLYDLGHRQA